MTCAFLSVGAPGWLDDYFFGFEILCEKRLIDGSMSLILSSS
jgi:hypothetical protein